MNGDSYLFGALYHTRGGFSRIRSFVQALPFDAASLPYDHAAVMAAVKNARTSLAVGNEELTAARARDLLIAEDLAKAEQVLADPAIVEQLNNRSEMEPILKQRFREAAHVS